MATLKAGSTGSTVVTTNTGAAVAAGTTAVAGELVILVVSIRLASAVVTTANGWITALTIPVSNGTGWILFREGDGASSWPSPIVTAGSQQQARIAGIFQGLTIPTGAPAKTALGSGSTSPITIPQVANGLNTGLAILITAESRGATAGASFSYTGTPWSTNELTDNATGTTTTSAAMGSAYAILTADGTTPAGTVVMATAGSYGTGLVVFDPAGAIVTPARTRTIGKWR